jgi:hypothetical protein
MPQGQRDDFGMSSSPCTDRGSRGGSSFFKCQNDSHVQEAHPNLQKNFSINKTQQIPTVFYELSLSSSTPSNLQDFTSSSVTFNIGNCLPFCIFFILLILY